MQNFVLSVMEQRLTERAPIRVGVVSEYDPTTHSVKLTIQPQGYETGFIALGSNHIGNGWGIAVGPAVGDQFIVGHINGHSNVPVILGRLFSDQETPPTVQSGELVIKHASGSSIFLDKNGGATLTANQGMTMSAGQGFSVSAGAPMSFTGGGNLQ